MGEFILFSMAKAGGELMVVENAETVEQLLVKQSHSCSQQSSVGIVLMS